MKKITADLRGKTIKQIDAMIFHRIVPDHHVPVFNYIREKVEKDEPFESDGHILLAAYRQFLRGAHLTAFNKNRPKRNDSFRNTKEYREKLRKAQTGKKHSPERIAKRAASIKATWARKRAEKEAAKKD